MKLKTIPVVFQFRDDVPPIGFAEVTTDGKVNIYITDETINAELIKENVRFISVGARIKVKPYLLNINDKDVNATVKHNQKSQKPPRGFRVDKLRFFKRPIRSWFR